MADGTADDYRRLDAGLRAEHTRLADRVLDLLRGLEGHNPGYLIDRYQHSLQTATRALRDGADEETVVAALVHDVGDLHAPENHSAFAAAILRPYVADDTYWMILHHGLFQGYYYVHHFGGDRNARERFRDHPAYRKTVAFCARWDQCSFDPDYDTLPLETFEPMVRRLFAREPKEFV
jgi:predicted HD phosphohydrolase